MKELPILYSTPMVQAKLAGRKTVTRRLRGLHFMNKHPDRWRVEQLENGLFRFSSLIFKERTKQGIKNSYIDKASPYGVAGDVLYGRETWQKSNDHNGEFSHYIYQADNDPLHAHRKWKPSIHMPKVTARIWERVVNVRVERLHDITEEDAMSEGVISKYVQFDRHDCVEELIWFSVPGFDDPGTGVSAVDMYSQLWESMNGPGSWEANPWVWRIETEVLSTTGKPEIL